LIDADTELACPIAFQRFQPIARQRCKIAQAGSCTKNFQSLPGLTLEPAKLTNGFTGRKTLGPPVSITQDHLASV
jgi:hypothetical protein